MNFASEKRAIIIAGLGIGMLAALLVLAGNPTPFLYCICIISYVCAVVKRNFSNFLLYLSTLSIGLRQTSYTLPAKDRVR